MKNTIETSMIRLNQTRMKIHHASSIRLIKNKLFTDENLYFKTKFQSLEV
jgi:hypothetical protein